MLVIPGWSQRVGALRRPMAGSGPDPESRDSGFDAEPVIGAGEPPAPLASPRNDGLKSGRAAHIGVAAANHALRRGLGVCLGGGSAGAIFELGCGLRSTPPEPRFGTDRQLCQCLSDVIDRVERVEGAGTGKSDFVDSGGNRRLDILTPPGTGIPFPFAPRGDHFGPFAARRPPSI